MPPPTGRRNAKRTRGCSENAISQHNQPKIQRRLGIKIIRFIPVCIHKPVATLKHFIGIHAVVCFIGCIHTRRPQMPEQKKKGTKGNYNQCHFPNEFCAMLLCIHLLSPMRPLSSSMLDAVDSSYTIFCDYQSPLAQAVPGTAEPLASSQQALRAYHASHSPI